MSAGARAFLFGLTIVLVLAGTILAIVFARGYRIDLGKKTVEPTGLLVATSIPDGAQVRVNGQLRTATNATLALSPGEYTVELKKDGFSTWQKRITLRAEEVVKTEATLFATAPSLRPVTFDGASGPILSPGGERLVYTMTLKQALETPGRTTATPAAVSPNLGGLAGQSGVQSQQPSVPQLLTKAGLWVLDLGDLLLGFSREPRQIARSNQSLDWSKASLFWSPDERQLLAVFFKSSPSGVPKIIKASDLRAAYLLDPSRLNSGSDLVDVANNFPAITAEWQDEIQRLEKTQLAKLPLLVRSLVATAAASFKFSPDETKILYQATASATLTKDIVPPLPGSNSQPQQRTLHPKGVYVYDLKEDRNFWIMDLEEVPSREQPFSTAFDTPARLSWFPTSRHLLSVEKNKVTILEYDNTNPVVVYSGQFADVAVFPYPNGAKLIVLTDLGSPSSTLNLYTLILR